MTKNEIDFIKKASFIVAFDLLKDECKKNEGCRTCKLYNHTGCLLSRPPEYIDVEEIVKRFT